MNHFSNDCGMGTVRGAAVDTANKLPHEKSSSRALGDFQGLLGAREFPTGRCVGFHYGNSRLGQHPTAGLAKLFWRKKRRGGGGEGNRARDSVTNRRRSS